MEAAAAARENNTRVSVAIGTLPLMRNTSMKNMVSETLSSDGGVCCNWSIGGTYISSYKLNVLIAPSLFFWFGLGCILLHYPLASKLVVVYIYVIDAIPFT